MSKAIQHHYNNQGASNSSTTIPNPNPRLIPKDHWINPTQFLFLDEANPTLLKGPSIIEIGMHQINAAASAIAKITAKIGNLKISKNLKRTMITNRQFPPHITNQVKVKDLNQANTLLIQLVQNEIKDIDSKLQDLLNEEVTVLTNFHNSIFAILTRHLSHQVALQIMRDQHNEVRQKISDRTFFYSATFEHNTENQRKEKEKKQISKDRNIAMDISSTTDSNIISAKDVDKLIENKLKKLVKNTKQLNHKDSDTSKPQKTEKKKPIKPTKPTKPPPKSNKKNPKAKGKFNKQDF